MHQPYPKWLYHPTKAAALVADEAEHKALGAGWAESPVDAVAKWAKDVAASTDPELDRPLSLEPEKPPEEELARVEREIDEAKTRAAAESERDLRRASGQEAADERAAMIGSKKKHKAKK